jgi:hypothetical protein
VVGAPPVSTALRQIKPLKVSEDIAVPRSKIPAMIERVHQLGREHEVLVATYGHAGDGNLHANFLYQTEEERRRVDAAVSRMLKDCIAMGGTLTGEHGIGIAKKEFLPLEQPAPLIELQRKLKKVFDPQGILNRARSSTDRQESPACARSCSRTGSFPARRWWSPPTATNALPRLGAAGGGGGRAARADAQGPGRRRHVAGLSERGLFVGITNRAGQAPDKARTSRARWSSRRSGPRRRDAARAARGARPAPLQPLPPALRRRREGLRHLVRRRQGAPAGPGDGPARRHRALAGGDDRGRTERLRRLFEEKLARRPPELEPFRALLTLHGPEGDPSAAAVHADVMGYGTRSGFVYLGGPSPRAWWMEGHPCEARVQDLRGMVEELYAGNAPNPT